MAVIFNPGLVPEWVVLLPSIATIDRSKHFDKTACSTQSWAQNAAPALPSRGVTWYFRAVSRLHVVVDVQVL